MNPPPTGYTNFFKNCVGLIDKNPEASKDGMKYPNLSLMTVLYKAKGFRMVVVNPSVLYNIMQSIILDDERLWD